MNATMISIPEWMQRVYPPADRPKKATVWKWIRNGQINPPPVRIGRSYQIDPRARHTQEAVNA